jgi:hypothetical protein
MRARATATSLVLIALLLAGCGSSSRSSSFSRTSAAPDTTYAAAGYRFSMPAGWKRFAVPAGPTGATGASLTAPDDSASIDTHSYPHSSVGVAESIRELAQSEQLELQAGGIRDLRSQLRSVAVPGAVQAKELSQTFVNKGGPQRLVKLIVMTRTGTLIDLEASASGRAAGFDPQRVIDSFKLAGG